MRATRVEPAGQVGQVGQVQSSVCTACLTYYKEREYFRTEYDRQRDEISILQTQKDRLLVDLRAKSELRTTPLKCISWSQNGWCSTGNLCKYTHTGPARQCYEDGTDARDKTIEAYQAKERTADAEIKRLLGYQAQLETRHEDEAFVSQDLKRQFDLERLNAKELMVDLQQARCLKLEDAKRMEDLGRENERMKRAIDELQKDTRRLKLEKETLNGRLLVHKSQESELQKLKQLLEEANKKRGDLRKKLDTEREINDKLQDLRRTSSSKKCFNCQDSAESIRDIESQLHASGREINSLRREIAVGRGKILEERTNVTKLTKSEAKYRKWFMTAKSEKKGVQKSYEDLVKVSKAKDKQLKITDEKLSNAMQDIVKLKKKKTKKLEKRRQEPLSDDAAPENHRLHPAKKLKVDAHKSVDTSVYKSLNAPSENSVSSTKSSSTFSSPAKPTSIPSASSAASPSVSSPAKMCDCSKTKAQLRDQVVKEVRKEFVERLRRSREDHKKLDEQLEMYENEREAEKEHWCTRIAIKELEIDKLTRRVKSQDELIEELNEKMKSAVLEEICPSKRSISVQTDMDFVCNYCLQKLDEPDPDWLRELNQPLGIKNESGNVKQEECRHFEGPCDCSSPMSMGSSFNLKFESDYAKSEKECPIASVEECEGEEQLDDDSSSEMEMVQCVLERILEKRVLNDNPQYLIKWEGYDSDENSWEPSEHIPDKLLRDFETQRSETVEARSESGSSLTLVQRTALAHSPSKLNTSPFKGARTGRRMSVARS